MKKLNLRLIGPTAKEALQGLDFHCKRFGCRMTQGECVARQAKALKPIGGKHCECIDCPDAVKARENKEIIVNEQPKAKYNCEKHGPHDGGMVAGQKHAKCPQCTEEKRRKNFAHVYEVQVTLKPPAWLVSWLREQAGETDLAEWIETRLIDSIPAEEIKKHLMANRRGK